MKNLLALIAIAVVTISCKELDIVQYEYRSTTMMGKTIVVVTADSVVISFNGRGEPTRTSRPTEASEWAALAKSMAGVDLTKIATLESPTNKRATDAAPFGTLLITTKDSTYTSAGFDGKNPHEMLMPLMQEMIKIWEKK